MAEVLSLVERGWRGARECSLVLGQRGDRVRHLIKGTLDPEVRAMIAPAPGVVCEDVPRALFRARMWWVLVRAVMGRRLRWVLVDNPRTEREVAGICRAGGSAVIAIKGTADGYILQRGSRAVTLQEAFGESLTTSSSK